MGKPRSRFGALRPRYRFALNPIAAVRWSRCPRCEKPMHDRKFPLLIHIDGVGLLILGFTCRYCTPCEFIIAHQAEMEEQLVIACEERGFADQVGNPYLLFGTVERQTWKEGMQGRLDVDTLRAHTADIKSYHTLNDPRPRWMPADESPQADGR
jgi:hypothetical protein